MTLDVRGGQKTCQKKLMGAECLACIHRWPAKRAVRVLVTSMRLFGLGLLLAGSAAAAWLAKRTCVGMLTLCAVFRQRHRETSHR
jgi:hypothetical protein